MHDRLAHALVAATLGLTLPIAVTAPAVATPTAQATVRAPEAAVPLMNLTNLSLAITQAGNNWTLKVTTTETFTQSELNQQFRFADAASIFERDTGEPFGGADDELLMHFEFGFVPTRTQQSITWTFPTTSNVLDTEDGSERIYGRVKLRNVTTGGAAIFARTPISTIDP
ncbi:hypothetical protein [Streptomyces sp. NPDC048269]|uniref:hypothetical protein n=1 Tax=Streptomyces sp. NPDC048269 TaxID=3155753 RepID=UPI00342BE848